jgi:hypothetical protein
VNDTFIIAGYGSIQSSNVLLSFRDPKPTQVLTTSIDNPGSDDIAVYRVGGSGTPSALEMSPLEFDQNLLGTAREYYAFNCYEVRTFNPEQARSGRSFIVNARIFDSFHSSKSAFGADCNKEVSGQNTNGDTRNKIPEK